MYASVWLIYSNPDNFGIFYDTSQFTQLVSLFEKRRYEIKI